jgi:hypothetical protein
MNGRVASAKNVEIDPKRTSKTCRICCSSPNIFVVASERDRLGNFGLAWQSFRKCGPIKDARSSGPSANAIAAALAPASRAPTLFRDSGWRLVGARHAIAAACHPAHGAPLAGLSRLRELLRLLRDDERRQQHSRDDQDFQHGDCPQRCNRVQHSGRSIQAGATPHRLSFMAAMPCALLASSRAAPRNRRVARSPTGPTRSHRE